MEVKYYNTSFKLDTLPLDAIHVIDNWLPDDLFTDFNNVLNKTLTISIYNQI